MSAGARTKCTPETIERLCEALELGATVRIACNCAGISVTTYHRWVSEAGRGGRPGSTGILGRRKSGARCRRSRAPGDDPGRVAGWRVEGLGVVARAR